MEINSVGIIGYGAFGAFVAELIKRFAPELQVKIQSERFTPDGSQFFDVTETCACDVVVLCCSIADYEAKLTELLPYIPNTTVIVDVATVKSHTSNLLARLAGDRPYVCTHPMFGPESYKKTNGDVSGYRVVVTEKTIDESAYRAIRAFVTACGFTVIDMSSDQHDQLLANTLFLTHYVAQTMKTAGFGRTELDSVSFQSLMNAVESVMHDGKLFHDVYQYNPYCKEAAERFHSAQDAVFKQLPK